ncbi:MAG TPA: VWA domain-containing protein [Pyrinomonadaceae bacterium]|nr:VWA domain-containing protein [Pyrinomonadaceae bacterium]
MDNIYRILVLLTILTAQTLTTITVTQTPQPPSLSTKIADSVTLNVTVTDKKERLVVGLKPSDFEISIDKKPAHIVSLKYVDEPVSVGILLDSSGSMSSRSDKQLASDLQALREGLRHFLEVSNQANDYFLLGFNIKPELLADWTLDHSAMLTSFDHLRVSGNTAFYDACYLAVDKLHGARHAKRVLVLISDGQDNISQYTFNELGELLRETNVVVYSIYFSNTVKTGSALGMEGSAVLEQLSLLSGGRVFFTQEWAALRSADAHAIFELIASELRNQYTLTIAPDDPLSSKKWHQIKVKVKLPPEREIKGLSVRTREGFYAR